MNIYGGAESLCNYYAWKKIWPFWQYLHNLCNCVYYLRLWHEFIVSYFAKDEFLLWTIIPCSNGYIIFLSNYLSHRPQGSVLGDRFYLCFFISPIVGVIQSSSEMSNKDNFSSIRGWHSASYWYKVIYTWVRRFPDMRPLHISLNTAHSWCKPNSSISSFTHSLQVFLPLPAHLISATTTFLQGDSVTPNHTHSYVPHAQTTSIYHASPLQTLNTQKTIQDLTSLPILQSHTKHPSHHHTLCSPQALQILSLHCPCLSPICQHPQDTGPKNLSLHVIGCTTDCKDVR